MFASGKFLGTGTVVRSYSTKKFTNAQKDSFSISPDLHRIIIGLILGDLYIERKLTTRNARLSFDQSIAHEEYITSLHDIFKDFCTLPLRYNTRKPDSRTGKIYTSIVFKTFSLPCFNYYHELFYVNGVKIIPLNIGELLTPVSLAYWAMDNGYKKDKNFILCTHSYTLSEVELLIKILKENFSLNCTYHVRNNCQYGIYIKIDSMDKFRSLVTPYFHPSMMYKLID